MTSLMIGGAIFTGTIAFGIYLFCALSFLVGIYISVRSGEKPNGNILLGVSLPYEALNNESVTDIVSQCGGTRNRVTLALLPTLIPYWFLRSFVSLSLIYMTLWIVLCLIAYNAAFERHAKALRALKRAQGWLVGTTQTLTIDTEVSRLKDSFPIPKLCFAPPLILCAAMLGLVFTREGATLFLFIPPLNALLMTVICFFLYSLYTRDKNEVYSTHSEVNLALNHFVKREWSKCWVWAACLQSALAAAGLWALWRKPDGIIMLGVSILFSAICIFMPVMRTQGRVRAEKTRLLALQNEVICIDDDEFWGGFGYRNPNDARLWVEKRVGYGMTVNMAKRGARIFVWLLMGGTAALMLGLSALLWPLDFGSIDIAFTEESIDIRAPRGDYSIERAGITELRLLEELPELRKIIGGDSARFLTGRFHVVGFGECRIYAHRGKGPYTAVKGAEGWVIWNRATPKETEEDYQRLQKPKGLCAVKKDVAYGAEM